MKFGGTLLFIVGLWLAYIAHDDPVEGKIACFVAIILVAVGFYLFFEGIRREIIENLERIIADKTQDLRREMKEVSHLVALHATVQEEGIREEIRSALKGIPAQQRTETIDIEQADE